MNAFSTGKGARTAESASTNALRREARPRWSARLPRRQRWFWVASSVCWLMLSHVQAQTNSFSAGSAAYRAGHYTTAASAFEREAKKQPASGTLQNLGLAEWRRGQRAAAILAWEQAVWMDPFNAATRENLQFARKAAMVEAPDYSWWEAASMWLPVNVWPVLAAGSFWLAVAMVLLSRVFRWPRATWHQALAAAGFAVFLVCLPSLYGVHTRARIGFVTGKETPLRLTPTRDAQAIQVLQEGQPVRCERTRGQYWFVRTGSGHGWVERTQVGRICPE
jgi:tetratricopeptide (TPR) repeat protein